MNGPYCAAKKTRDAHAGAADRTLVKDLDVLMAEITLKHTQISLADANSVAGPAPAAAAASNGEGGASLTRLTR